jgi:dTMP kinase
MNDDGCYTIGFSGIDGSGKSTQAQRLADTLAEAGADVIMTKSRARAITSIFRLSEQLYGDPYAYHPAFPATLREMLVASDVEDHHHHILVPNRRSGRIIVSDRCKYCFETYAHAYGADMTWISKVYDLVSGPDLIFLLDVPGDVAFARLMQRSEKPAKSDENPGFLEKVRQHYLMRATLLSNLVIVDGKDSPNQIAASILRYLAEHAPFPINPALVDQAEALA